MMSDDDILEAGGTQEDINNYAHDVGGACGGPYAGTCDHPGCRFNTSSLTDILEELLWGEHDDERKAIADAKALLEKRELEARLDELQQATDKRYTGINHLRNVGYLRNRIVELTEELERLNT